MGRSVIFILLPLQLVRGFNVADLSPSMYFVRHNSVVHLGFSDALGCLAAFSTKTFQTNAYQKCFKIGGDTLTKMSNEVCQNEEMALLHNSVFLVNL